MSKSDLTYFTLPAKDLQSLLEICHLNVFNAKTYQNMENRKTVIVGASGFGREVLTCLIDVYKSQGITLSKQAICFLETEEFCEKTKLIHGFEVLPEKDFNPTNAEVLVAVGDGRLRKKIVERLPENTKFATLIHPTATVSEWVELGEGSIVTAGVILTTDIKIGTHAHLNLTSTVGHDCQIGDYFTSSPGTNISGICNIGDNVYFGTNSSVRQGITICQDVVIGMGGVVVKNITESGIYVGNPATKLETNKK
ncbi:MAG: sugar O-acyltransferase (sialic acid O-acetyltransferase NeuD family) [Arenicella sp.]|jgi:sugar O-acyltransferase (sialic acid O-acetyltransferase NeuD family)